MSETHKIMVVRGSGFEVRDENRAEREKRERTEAIAKQKSEVNRLRDWLARLGWKLTQHEDGLRDAQIAVEMNRNGIETTKKKIADTKDDLLSAEERLQKMERAA